MLKELKLNGDNYIALVSNADMKHVENVLEALDFESSMFDTIIDYHLFAQHDTCKPYPTSYDVVKAKITQDIAVRSPSCRRVDDDTNWIFIDDSLKNLAGAKSKGFKTILVRETPYVVDGGDGIDVVVTSLLQLKVCDCK